MPAVLPLLTGAATVVLLSRYPAALAAVAVAAAVGLAARFAIGRSAR